MNNQLDQQELKWLLRDKYHLSQKEIEEFLSVNPGLGFEPTAHPGSRITGVTFADFQSDLYRLAQGEPLQYVIGWVPFLGAKIDLSLRPLIPRPETEFWVEKVITELKHEQRPLKVLDLCCGSGCIGIAVLASVPEVQLEFVDISPAVLEQTKLNVHLNHLDNRQFEILQSDLFTKLGNHRYDVILSNPPYVDPDGEVSPELAFEPATALFAQNHGFGLIEQVLFQSKKHLERTGRLVIEFGQGQAEEIRKLAEAAGWEEIVFKPDQYGVTRWVRLKK